jgi:hypothetical protein
MPFVNRQQRAKCWLLKAKGQNGSWNCDEWEEHTPSKLPDKVKKAAEIALNFFLKRGLLGNSGLGLTAGRKPSGNAPGAVPSVQPPKPMPRPGLENAPKTLAVAPNQPQQPVLPVKRAVWSSVQADGDHADRAGGLQGMGTQLAQAAYQAACRAYGSGRGRGGWGGDGWKAASGTPSADPRHHVILYTAALPATRQKVAQQAPELLGWLARCADMGHDFPDSGSSRAVSAPGLAVTVVCGKTLVMPARSAARSATCSSATSSARSTCRGESLGDDAVIIVGETSRLSRCR